MDGAQRNQFFNRLRFVLHRLKVKDFCYEDLLRPEKERFIKQMSGVVNFMRFRDERLKRLQVNNTSIAFHLIPDPLYRAVNKQELLLKNNVRNTNKI